MRCVSLHVKRSCVNVLASHVVCCAHGFLSVDADPWRSWFVRFAFHPLDVDPWLFLSFVSYSLGSAFHCRAVAWFVSGLLAQLFELIAPTDGNAVKVEEISPL